MKMQQENAQIIGMKALGWIAAQDSVFEAFLNTTGAKVDDLRQQAADPSFLAQVLDFVMLQDEWVLSFAADSAIAPEQVVAARAVLGGGDTMNWT
jgi:hypothetical protein